MTVLGFFAFAVFCLCLGGIVLCNGRPVECLPYSKLDRPLYHPSAVCSATYWIGPLTDTIGSSPVMFFMSLVTY